MAITVNDIIKVALTDDELQNWLEVAARVAPHIRDRVDLHGRDYLERYINVAMGEIAEQMVIKWLHDNGKQARSAVDKTATVPDTGHDIIVTNTNGKDVECSVKSSLSALKQEQGILSEFRLASKKSELRPVNIQVYFWLILNPPPRGSRITVPSTTNAAIIGWATRGEIEAKGFTEYATEDRQSPKMKLHEMNTMQSLLSKII